MAALTSQAQPRGRILRFGAIIVVVLAATAHGQQTGVRLYPGLETSRPTMGVPMTPIDSSNINWSQYPAGHLWNSYCQECGYATCRCRGGLLEFLNPFAIIDVIFHRCKGCHRSECDCQHKKHDSSHSHAPHDNHSHSVAPPRPPAVDTGPNRRFPGHNVVPPRHQHQQPPLQHRPARPITPRATPPNVNNALSPRPLTPARPHSQGPPPVHVEQPDPLRPNTVPHQPIPPRQVTPPRQTTPSAQRPAVETTPPAAIVRENPVIVNSEPVPANQGRTSDAPRVNSVQEVPNLPEMDVPKNEIPKNRKSSIPTLKKKSPAKNAPRTSLRYYIITY